MNKLIVINNPKKIVHVIPSRPKNRVIKALGIKRGERGATDIVAIAPLELDNNDQLSFKPFEFIQTSTLATWFISHGLGRRPLSVYVEDDFGKEIIGEISHPTDILMRVDFLVARTGKVTYL